MSIFYGKLLKIKYYIHLDYGWTKIEFGGTYFNENKISLTN